MTRAPVAATAPRDDQATDALDALPFDSSLSFLADADGIPITTPVATPRAEPNDRLLLFDSADDDLNTSALLNALLTSERDERGEFQSSDPSEKSPETSPVRDEASSESSLTPPRTPPADAPMAAPLKQQKRKRIATNVRKKKEIEYLRVQVTELERELARLKQPPVGAVAAAAVSVWASIAQRQSAEKQRAEIENMKLRSMLEGQLRVARSLEKLLRKRLVSESDALFLERKRSREPPALGLQSVVEDIRVRIRHQLDDVDTVMSECGLASITTAFEDVCVTSDSADSICMELAAIKVFPFAMANVAEAMWQVMSAPRIELSNGYYGTTTRSEMTADQQFAVKLRVRRSDATVHVRGVTTRRTDANQMRCVFEAAGATDGPLFSAQGVRCRERGYTLVEASPASAIAPSTVVKVCVRLWPDVDVTTCNLESSGTPDVGLFIDLVVGSFHQNVKSVLQAAENMLIGGSLSKPAT